MSSEVPENVTKRNSLVGEGGVSGERAAPPPQDKGSGFLPNTRKIHIIVILQLTQRL